MPRRSSARVTREAGTFREADLWRMVHGLAARALVCCLIVVGGCGYSVPDPAAPLSSRAPLCLGSDDAGTGSNCLSVARVEGWLTDPNLEIIGAAEAPRGIQHTRVLTLRTRESGRSIVFRAKWRAISTMSSHNDPRKELAAYGVQRLFLEPAEFVVPPTAAGCLELDSYRRLVDAAAEPTFERLKCVFGFLQYWLEAAVPLDEADDAGWLDASDGPLDRDLFDHDPGYRRMLVHLNLLTYLIDHDDTHAGQFLVTRADERLRIYSVDNSMSFEDRTNPTLDEDEDWSRIQVPSLDSASLDRLRALTDADFEALLVLQQFELNSGRLLPVELGPGVRKSTSGLAWDGRRLNVGLRRSEVAQLKRRTRALLSRVAERQVSRR